MTRGKRNANAEPSLSTPLTQQVERALTVDQIISAGESAAQTLGSPVVNVAVQLLREELYQRIATSQPHEQKLREAAYLELHSLQSVLGHLERLYKAAQMHVDRIESEPQREQAEYYENQGFN